MDINDAVRKAQEEIESYRNAQKNIVELKDQLHEEISKLQDALNILNNVFEQPVTIDKTDSKKEEDNSGDSHDFTNDKNDASGLKGKLEKSSEIEKQVNEIPEDDTKKTVAKSTSKKPPVKKEEVSEIIDENEEKEIDNKNLKTEEDNAKIVKTNEENRINDIIEDDEEDSIFDLNNSSFSNDVEDIDDIPF